MPTVKKTAVILDPARDVKKELNRLYARRSTIDALIASLQEYDRYRGMRVSREQRRKTA